MDKVSVIQGSIFQKHIDYAILRNGSLVTGRVLAKNPDGSYSVSLAGKKINVKSEHPLSPGKVFSAKVLLKGDSVTLALVKEGSENPALLQKIGVGAELPPHVANLLLALGLNANEETFNLLLFMHQIGMQIDAQAARKVLQKTKDSENQEENSQLALLLKEKGIRVDEEKVRAVFAHNFGKQENHGQGNTGYNQHEGRQYGVTEQKMNASHVKNFFSQVDDASLSRSQGLLSAFNTVLSSGKNQPPLQHWMVFPFEWDFRQSTGNIKMLFDSDLRNLKKVVVNVKNASTESIFVINYKNNSPDSLKFSTNNFSDKNKKDFLCGLLSSMFHSKITVDFVDYGSLQGFCSGDECFFSVDGSL